MVFEESVVLGVPFAQALAATKVALADHGFGVLTEIARAEDRLAAVQRVRPPVSEIIIRDRLT